MKLINNTDIVLFMKHSFTGCGTKRTEPQMGLT